MNLHKSGWIAAVPEENTEISLEAVLELSKSETPPTGGWQRHLQPAVIGAVQLIVSTVLCSQEKVGEFDF